MMSWDRDNAQCRLPISVRIIAVFHDAVFTGAGRFAAEARFELQGHAAALVASPVMDGDYGIELLSRSYRARRSASCSALKRSERPRLSRCGSRPARDAVSLWKTR